MVRTGWRVWLTTLILAAGLPGVSFADSEQPALPEGFFVCPSVRPLVEAMWQRSPGFRSQVNRIVDANVRVVLQVVSPIELDRASANATIIREHGSVRYVRIRLRVATDWAPLIPHELEHVLEAIEGVDLPALAGHRGDVWRTGRDRYESARAQQAGLRIAREYRRGDPVLSARVNRD